MLDDERFTATTDAIPNDHKLHIKIDNLNAKLDDNFKYLITLMAKGFVIIGTVMIGLFGLVAHGFHWI